MRMRVNRLRAVAWSLSLGFACTGLFAAVVGKAVPIALWLASHLATEPLARSVLTIACLGIIQSLICAVALSLIAVVTELSLGVSIAASLFSAAAPLVVLLVAQGPKALLPAPLLLARLCVVALCAGLAGASVGAVRRWQVRRSANASR